MLNFPLTLGFDNAPILIQALRSNPLAIRLAEAYIQVSSGSFATYLPLYQEQLGISLGYSQQEVPAYPHRTIAAFEISFRALERQHKKAADFLQLCAFLHNENISVEFICRGLDQDGEWQSPSYGSK